MKWHGQQLRPGEACALLGIAALIVVVLHALPWSHAGSDYPRMSDSVRESVLRHAATKLIHITREAGEPPKLGEIERLIGPLLSGRTIVGCRILVDENYVRLHLKGPRDEITIVDIAGR